MKHPIAKRRLSLFIKFSFLCGINAKPLIKPIIKNICKIPVCCESIGGFIVKVKLVFTRCRL